MINRPEMGSVPPALPVSIVFMGSPEFAVPSLNALNDCTDVKAVYTQPPRPQGRGMSVRPTAIGQKAEDLGLPCFWPETLKSNSVQAELAAFKADLFVVVAYGLLLPQPVLDIPRLGCVNGHASLLPRWRGAAPIQRALEAGDSHSGVTAMLMEAGLDTGPMLEKHTIPLSSDMTAGDVHDVLADITASCLVSAVGALANGTARPIPQDDAHAVYAAKITNDETKLDLNGNAEALGRKIRAFSPYPGCWIQTVSGRLKIIKADYCDMQTHQQVGYFCGTDKIGRMLISCGQGMLAISAVQPAGKKKMPAHDFLNGQNWMQGQRIVDE